MRDRIRQITNQRKLLTTSPVVAHFVPNVVPAAECATPLNRNSLRLAQREEWGAEFARVFELGKIRTAKPLRLAV